MGPRFRTALPMETYSHLLVRLHPESSFSETHRTLQALPGGLEWEEQEAQDGVLVLYAMAGSAGWEATDAAATALRDAGHPEVWTYCTHDEDSEALFTSYANDRNWSFIASTAYEGFHEDGEPEPLDEDTARALLDDPTLDDHEVRAQLGESAYCWGRYDQWREGLSGLHCLATFEELIQDVVGARSE